MSSFWSTYKKTFVFVLLVILSLSFIVLPTTNQVRNFRLFIHYLFYPSQKIAEKIIIGSAGFWKNIYTLISVHQKNLFLEEQVYRLTSQLNQLQEEISENKRLKDILRYKQSLPQATVCAQVISADPHNIFSYLWINKGLNDGIEKDMLVIAYQEGREGVVGRIIESLPDKSQVILITSSESQIRVVVQRTRFDGILIGQDNNQTRLQYFLPEAEIQEGDLMVTSTKQNIFPAGMIVGRVAKVFMEENKLFKAGLVTPLVNFGKLEEVLVVLKKG